MHEDLCYLDYAATSAIRPAAVTSAVSAYLAGVGATPGRGGHRLATEAGRVALRTRLALARLAGLPGDPGRLAFMLNATHAINTALAGLLGPGDAVVVTAFDHNATIRPAHRLAATRGVEVRLVGGYPDGTLDDGALDHALAGAKLLCVNHASNVLGTALDAAALTERAHAHGALVLLDTAQSAGHIPLDVDRSGADLVAFAGHKGLLGPQGTGALWVRDGVDIEPLLTGGTGGDSLSPEMPAAFPDHLEAGTMNAPGIAGLGAGVAWLLEHGLEPLHARLRELKGQLWEGLSALPGVRVVSPPAPDGAPIVTFSSPWADPATLAHRLDREHGVLARPGLHCAPGVHRLLGTDATGAVRLSLGWASTADDVVRAVAAVAAATAAGLAAGGHRFETTAPRAASG